MTRFLAESIDQVLLERVSQLLSRYRVEEVQAAVNYLVSDSKWLSEHRRQSSPEQRTIEALTSNHLPLTRVNSVGQTEYLGKGGYYET